jgi:hypothetical protein
MASRYTIARLSDRIETLARLLSRDGETSLVVIWLEPGEDVELIFEHEKEISARSRQVVVVTWGGLGCARPRPELCSSRSLGPYVPVARAKIGGLAANKWATITPEGREFMRALDEHWRNLCRRFEINYDECA